MFGLAFIVMTLAQTKALVPALGVTPLPEIALVGINVDVTVRPWGGGTDRDLLYGFDREHDRLWYGPEAPPAKLIYCVVRSHAPAGAFGVVGGSLTDHVVRDACFRADRDQLVMLPAADPAGVGVHSTEMTAMQFVEVNAVDPGSR